MLRGKFKGAKEKCLWQLMKTREDNCEGVRASLVVQWLRTHLPKKKKKNPPANAGDTGSSPGPGRSHMPQRN